MIIPHSIASVVHRLAHAQSETLGAALARVALHRGELIAKSGEARGGVQDAPAAGGGDRAGPVDKTA